MLVYLGLGSNIGIRAQLVRQALEAMPAAGLSVLRVSSLYETEPWGVGGQPRFLNAVCSVETELSPTDLLVAVKGIEQALGRQPGVRWGPRPIDIDILLYGGLQVHTNDLSIPHAGMLWRASVLVPMAEIAPDLVHPLTGRSMRDHLRDLGPTPDVALYPPGLPEKPQ
jgi:2-amino-4-hydroxy-6-hydroxymethyldihydropteridine diphosphokinase